MRAHQVEKASPCFHLKAFGATFQSLERAFGADSLGTAHVRGQMKGYIYNYTLNNWENLYTIHISTITVGAVPK